MGTLIKVSEWGGESSAEGEGSRRGAAEEMGRFAREILASYEARVSSVETIFETTHQMLGAFRGQREEMLAQLREALARHASLRKRDFGTMMDQVLSRQAEREEAVRRSVNGYLREQRALAAGLREAMSIVDPGRIAEVIALLRGMAATQAGREREVKTLLAQCRAEHEEMAQALRALLGNGGPLKVKDFKAALRSMRAERSAWGNAGGGNRRHPAAARVATRNDP
jgi:hypothetical protein